MTEKWLFRIDRDGKPVFGVRDGEIWVSSEMEVSEAAKIVLKGMEELLSPRILYNQRRVEKLEQCIDQMRRRTQAHSARVDRLISRALKDESETDKEL